MALNPHPIRHESGATDYRYRIAREYTGHASGRPLFVLRFCDERISDHFGYGGALTAAACHNAARQGAMIAAAVEGAAQ